MSALSLTCSFGSNDSHCGPFANNSAIIPLEKCDHDMTSYLVSLGVSVKRSKDQHALSEISLILNRAGRVEESTEVATMTICPRHRRELTLDWLGRKRRTCCHPLHKGLQKQMANFRRVNASMSDEILSLHKLAVPIGSAICTNCRKRHYKDYASVSSTKTSTGEAVEVVALPSTSGFVTHTTTSDMSQECPEASKADEDISFAQRPHVENPSDKIANLVAKDPQANTSDEEMFSSGSQSSLQSADSIPEQEISIWLDEKEEQHTKRKALNDAFGSVTDGRVSPLQSTLNTEWNDISSTQQKYYLRKAKEMFLTTLSVISPGQEEQLWKSLRRETILENQTDGESKETTPKHFDIESDLIDALVKAHNDAQTWQTKRQILSIFANDFSRLELQKIIPGLTKWRIDQARDHATKSGKGQPIPDKQIFRTRLEYAKVDHFLDFVSRPEFLQDVAFGTKTMKLDSGKQIIIPAVVRTLIPTRIIDQYLSYCNQQQFEPAGERSLFRILDVCSASMQKSLQGLDNITAEGTEAIDNLMSLTQTMVEYGADESWAKTIKNNIKEAKRYLKTDYKAHVGREENCPDHCSTYALSDARQEYETKCSHKHDIECDRCESLEFTLKDVKEKIKSISIDEQQRNRILFDFTQCDAAIRAWKAHLLRTVLQEEAKQDAMSKLDQQTCLIIVDWAMKFLPMKYRESMSEFFGKRGLSWHVSAVVTRREENYEVECFVHIFNACTQNNYAVASLLDHLFKTIKAEHSLITQAYLRSDNAGCYHNGPLIVYLADMGQRTGVSVIRYDFSDPQAGKDICDRKTAPMKAHIRRYVNENHDVTTAEDMKTAIESHGGLTGCRVSVVEIDSSKDLDDAFNKIPGISLLYNFMYEEKGVRVWKAYRIGKGKHLPYKEFRKQRIDDLKVILPFAPRQKERGVIRASTATGASEIFGCNENNCILTFKTEEEAQAHMDTGMHVKELESVSLYDTIRKKWADRVTGISQPENPPSLRTVDQPSFEPAKRSTPSQKMGWALKTVKEKKRFEEKVKVYLIEKFGEGQRTGNKADPVAVSKEMKVKKDEDGKLFFEPCEWKTAQQIKSFFSRHNAKLKEMNAGDEVNEEDVEALEAEMSRQDLLIAIQQEMSELQHPIEVEQVNICKFSKEKNLKSLKLAQLKSICQDLHLEVKGSQARKKTFIDALDELVKKCSCSR